MADAEAAIKSSSMADRNSTEWKKNAVSQDHKNGTSRRATSRRSASLPTSYARKYSQRPFFRTKIIDPEVDREIVANAVDFLVIASSGGSVSFVTIFAQHLKYLLSLEEKVKVLTKEIEELKTLKSSPDHFTPISLESETSKLTKLALVNNVRESSTITPENSTDEHLLPGFVPHPPSKSSKSQPAIVISEFQEKVAAFLSNTATGSLPQICPQKLSQGNKEKSSEKATQTPSTDTRKPVMVERACSPISKESDPLCIKLQEQLKAAEDMVHSLLDQQLLQTKIKKNCEDMGTQTECETDSRPTAIDRDTQTEDKCQTYTQKPDFQKVDQVLSESLPAELTHRRSSPSSVTNVSTKSYPGAKEQSRSRRRERCPCSTCIQTKKMLRRKREEANIIYKENQPQCQRLQRKNIKDVS